MGSLAPEVAVWLVWLLYLLTFKRDEIITFTFNGMEGWHDRNRSVGMDGYILFWIIAVMPSSEVHYSY